MKKLSFLRWATALLSVLLLAGSLPGLQGAQSRLPAPDLNLQLAAPITTWDEAIPLGNGLMGGLLWGENQTLRISLDRGDLWDERPAAEPEWWKKHTYARMQQLVKEKQFDEVNRLFDSPYNGVTPTKLPAGRLEVTLGAGQQLQSFELDLAGAEGRARLGNGATIRGFFSAAQPVALFRIPGPEPVAIDLLSPVDVNRKTGGSSAGPSSGGSVDRLGYPEARKGSAGKAKWYVQEAAEGLSYCVCVDTRRSGNETLLAVTVTSTRDDPDPLGLARKLCSSALRKGYKSMMGPHLTWWKRFWEKSAVQVPDLAAAKHYYLVQYFYGAASRRQAPPMPLQGVWTADAGGLPPWKGDYHNDLNTQMTYIGYQTAGRFDEGACFLDYLWNLLPVFREFARDFYGTPGAAVPGVMSLAGQPLGGWGQYSLSPTMGAWNAHLFYLHWRYTEDRQFLCTRAYPWCSEIGECLNSLLRPNAQGTLVLPLSTSPEIFDNTGRAFVEPNSNYDLACLKMLFLSLAEMAEACGRPNEAERWVATAKGLGDFHADAHGMLLIDPKTPLPYSHRHLSNLMGIHPFNLLTTESGSGDRQRIDASLKQWDQLGTSQWCGYSFSWMSCLRARVGDAESALRNLDIYLKAFILRNGFHANGDQTKSGYSSMTYRPFTLEGNFLAAQAVHEMLLQSWSPSPGKPGTEVIRLFPATPTRWSQASFEDLGTEGGHRVSAKRMNGRTAWFRLVAGKTGWVRILDNFDGREVRWSRKGVRKEGGVYLVELRRGQSIECSLEPNH